MNKHTRSILVFCLVIVTVLASGCGQLDNSNRQSAVNPRGVLIYSDYTAIYSYDFQTQENKVVFTGNPIELATDKEYIYFRGAQETSKKLDLYKIKFNGSNLEQLTTDGNVSSFLLDPTNRYLAYEQSDRGRNSYISILDLNNNSSQVIAKENGHSFQNPFWSLDSKELLFCDAQPGFTTGRLIMYSLKKQETTELLSNLSGCFLTWLPDRNRISVSIADNEKWGTYIFDLNTLSLSEFFKGNQILPTSLPIWSPKGDKIVYETYEYGNGYQLILLDINSDIKTIIQEKGVDDWSYHPTWSLDGNYLAYFTISSLNTFPPMLNIYKVSSGEHSEIEILGNWIISPVWIDR